MCRVGIHLQRFPFLLIHMNVMCCTVNINDRIEAGKRTFLDNKGKVLKNRQGQ